MWFLEKDTKFIVLFSMIFIYVLFFGFYSWPLPRYMLPTYPYFFIIFGISLREIFGDRKIKIIIAISLLLIILFVSRWNENRNLTVGFDLEDNMEYLDFIQVRKDAAMFIEENYPNETFIAPEWDIGAGLKNPEFGYVKKPIKIVSIDDKNNLLNPDYKFIYYAPFIPSEVFNPDEFSKNNTIKLVQRFEKNKKYVEIYEIKR